MLDTFHMNIEEKTRLLPSSKAGKVLGLSRLWERSGTPVTITLIGNAIAALEKAWLSGRPWSSNPSRTDVKVIARAAAIWRRIGTTRDESPLKAQIPAAPSSGEGQTGKAAKRTKGQNRQNRAKKHREEAPPMTKVL